MSVKDAGPNGIETGGHVAAEAVEAPVHFAAPATMEA